jgi:hypothetical protein
MRQAKAVPPAQESVNEDKSGSATKKKKMKQMQGQVPSPPLSDCVIMALCA